MNYFCIFLASFTFSLLLRAADCYLSLPSALRLHRALRPASVSDGIALRGGSRPYPDFGLSMVSTVSGEDLKSIGEDIIVNPPSNGVTKIVMKFGGSSLASAERITYVCR